MNNRIALALAVTVAIAGASPVASAQVPIDERTNRAYEVPALIIDTPDYDTPIDTDDLDLANVVLTAAKGVTTVQEAPAIITVITEQDLRERGIFRLDDALDMVPGWLRLDAIYGQFPYGLTRGTTQSMLYLQNGVSLFDPALNIPSVGRIVPMETVKRIEVVTGPGGVLWGANSYMGVVNVVTKDGSDVDGVEADVRVGDGAGNREMLRGYVMAGTPELFGNDDASLLLHASFDTYQGARLELPQHLFSTPIPQPNSVAVYGPLTASEQARSTVFQANSKLTYGNFELVVHAPIRVERHLPAGFLGAVTRADLPDDALRDPMSGAAMCSEVPLHTADGQRNPDAYDTSDACVDRARIGRDNRADFFERYALLQYAHTSRSGDAVTARAYATQFNRGFPQLALMAPSRLVEGGISFEFDLIAYRAGVAVDGVARLGHRTRILYGAEAFREWIANDTTQSRQGEGVEARFIGPSDLGRLALPCPQEPVAGADNRTQLLPDCPLTFMFAVDRAVVGAYVNPQLRLDKLTLDGGVRAQVAPDAFGSAPYPVQFVLSGAAVYALSDAWHAKLNYSEGFRPPVFNNIASNGAGIQIEGSRDLEIETSRSVQGEVNTRAFQGKRALREVSFRADYSYTWLDNVIQVLDGFYANAADRGIHSAELLAKVHIQGGHRVELGYTFLRVDAADRGTMRTMPQHWFHLGGVFNLVRDRLQVATDLKVVGAMEDPNRIVEHRTMNEFGQQIAVTPHELSLDRLPPSGELTAGITWLRAFGVDGMTLRTFAYNALNSRHYSPDAFGDYEPRLEFLPNPRPDFRFVTNVGYVY